MTKRFTIVVGALAILVAGSTAGAAPTAPSSGATARAFAIRVVVPGGGGSSIGAVSAPPDAVNFGGGFAYPEDGSIVTSGSITASASASTTDATATARASSEVSSLSLFGGEVTVASVTARASADADNGKASGDLSQSGVSGLTVLGAAVEVGPGSRVSLGDWGYAIALAQGAAPTGDGYRGFVTALDVYLTAEHNGLPAGTNIQVGYAEAVAQAAAIPPPTTTARPTTTRPAPTPTRPKPPAATPSPGRGIPPGAVRPVPGLTPRLTKGGYVFPVHGPASFTDTFGAGRAVVGWHHGEDIFAPMGAPVLAVADGTVFSVGWNDIGGNRLWLRDKEGNEFYYAHLSAFTPLAVNGAQVKAGDVLGFVGNSGDAEATPPHLHFEIHPVSLLVLGYDGVINPYEYLLAWQRLEDVRFVVGAGWAPRALSTSAAPQPGAYLLSSTDISSASGLDPGSLRRALAKPVSAEGDALEVNAPATGGPPALRTLAGSR